MAGERVWTCDDDILHRHANGLEHAHKGERGFGIGAQVIEDTLGDEPSHEHRSMLLGSLGPPRDPSGPVVWSERLGDITPEEA